MEVEAGILSDGFFANDFAGIFILPQTKEHRLPQTAIIGPFRKLYLTHQLWAHPVTASHFSGCDPLPPFAGFCRRKIREGAFVRFDLLESRVQLPQRRAVESSAHLARGNELSLFLHSHNEGAKG